MADRQGEQLGNYRLIRLLGRGGFADVYLGEHVYLKTHAAIKILHTQLTEEDLQDFLQEAQTIAHLEHPHIVRILDFGVQGSTPFLVMSYASGGTLRTLHSKGSIVLLTTIISYIKQSALALQHAHDQKRIHRDIKPENLLVGRNHEILVSDFGIAAVAHSTTSLKTGAYSGTVHYSAPEQYLGKPRPASDQYALGIIVYEWLTGMRPFSGESYIEIAMHHISDPPPPLRSKVPSISPNIEQVVLQALAKDPQRRFASVQAFATALEQASQAAELPTFIKPQPIPPPPPIANNPVAPSPSPIQQPIAPPPPGQAAQVPPFQQASFASSSSTLAEVRPVTGPSGGKIGVAEGKDEKGNVWRIGKRQIVAMIVGAILCGSFATIGYFLDKAPSQSILMIIAAAVSFALAYGGLLFSATIFGPWVGFFVGGVESFIFDGLSGRLRGGFEYFIIGFAIAGLTLLSTKGRYNKFRAIATAAGISFIGLFVGFVVTNLLAGGILFSFSDLLQVAFPSFIPLPIMLLVYNRIVSHRQRA